MTVAAGVCVGLVPFCYLPLRSMQGPACDWGNPETVRGFWWLVSGQEFAGLIFGASAREWCRNLEHCLRLFTAHLGWPVVGLALVSTVAGAALWFQGKRNEALPLLLPATVLVSDLILVTTYDMTSDRYVWESYLLPGYAALAVMAAGGGGWLARRAAPWGNRAAWLVTVVALVVSLHSAFRQYPLCNKSRVTAAREHGLALVDQIGPGGVLAHNASEVEFIVQYLDQVEGRGGGVVRVYLPLLAYDWYSQQLQDRYAGLTVPAAALTAPREFIDANRARVLWAYPGGLGRHFAPAELAPAGLLFRVDGAGEALPERLAQMVGRALAFDYDGPTVRAHMSLIYHFAMHLSELGDTTSAEEWLSEAIRVGEQARAWRDSDVLQVTSQCRLAIGGLRATAGDYAEAEAQLAKARHLWSASARGDREVRWGLLRARQGDGEGAMLHLRRALREDPGNPVARRIIDGLSG